MILRVALCWLFAGVTSHSKCQSDPSTLANVAIPAMEVENGDVQVVLTKLLTKVGVPFVIATNVRGRVTFRLPRMSLLGAIDRIAASCGAGRTTSRGGLYITGGIVPRTFHRSPAIEIPTRDLGDLIAPAQSADSVELAFVVYRLFRSVGGYFIFPNEGRGTVSLRLPGGPFERTLQLILQGNDLTYRVEEGIYEIIQRKEPGFAQEPSACPIRLCEETNLRDSSPG